MQGPDTSDSSSPPSAEWRSGRTHDETYSFILRVGQDRVSGNKPARPLFRLEDVSAGREWRFTDFDSAAECLAQRVHFIINRPDPG